MELGAVADQILAALEARPDPLTIEELSHVTAIPANTLRRHVELLLARGQLRREREVPTGRGRPRWLYSRGHDQPQMFGSLLTALTQQLVSTSDQETIDAVGNTWAELMPFATRRNTPDEAVAATADALTHLGFGAEVNAPGDSISLSHCPYAKLVDKNPVICNIHGALVAKLLEQSGQDVTMESLDVWAGKRLCVVHLNRPDLKRERKITSKDLARPKKGM